MVINNIKEKVMSRPKLDCPVCKGEKKVNGEPCHNCCRYSMVENRLTMVGKPTGKVKGRYVKPA